MDVAFDDFEEDWGTILRRNKDLQRQAASKIDRLTRFRCKSSEWGLAEASNALFLMQQLSRVSYAGKLRIAEIAGSKLKS